MRTMVLSNRHIDGIDTVGYNRSRLRSYLRGVDICYVMCRYVTHNQVEIVRSADCDVVYIQRVAMLRVAMLRVAMLREGKNV